LSKRTAVTLGNRRLYAVLNSFDLIKRTSPLTCTARDRIDALTEMLLAHVRTKEVILASETVTNREDDGLHRVAYEHVRPVLGAARHLREQAVVKA